MLEEKEPLYFTEFRKSIDRKFEDTKNDLKGFIEVSINELASMTAKHYGNLDKRIDGIDRRLDGMDEKFSSINDKFDRIDNRFDRIESDITEMKVSIGKIEGHIGRYEVRAQNIEAILLEDHKPRIIALEKSVF